MADRILTAHQVARQHIHYAYQGDPRAFLWQSQRRGWTYEPVHQSVRRAQAPARFAWLAIVATEDGVGVTDDSGAVEVLPWDVVLASTETRE
jgi:hypothetical protein